MTKVLAFGTFDGLHEGHREFFRQARLHGDYLVVAVARDEVVKQLKSRSPRKSLKERIEMLANETVADMIIPGDQELGSYEVVKRHRPHVIALGYDQAALKKDLEGHLQDFGWHIDIIVLEPHEPKRYHNRLL